MNKNVERDWMTEAKRKIAYVNLFHYLKTTSTQLEQKLSPQCNMLQSRPAKIRWIVDAIKCQIFAAVGCLLLQILSVRFSFTRHRNVIFNCSFAFNPQIALAPLRGVSHCRSGEIVCQQELRRVGLSRTSPHDLSVLSKGNMTKGMLFHKSIYFPVDAFLHPKVYW